MSKNKKTSRIDISDWVIHFVHDRNPDFIEWTIDGNEVNTPLAYTEQGRPINFDLEYFRSFEPMDYEASAFEVLMRIIDDGYLKLSWSLRNRRPTIYGPRAAVCLTEMPLFALIEYQKERANRGFVGRYAIALRKDEFFRLGGRPVIYGLSGEHSEAKPGDANFGPTRNLSATTGIGLKEQYRYVAMNLGGNKRIDWSHEREWRWTKQFNADDFYFPGLPIWAKEYDDPDNIGFTKVLIITETQSEAVEVIDKLKEYEDCGHNNYDTQFDKALLRNTFITSFEALSEFESTSNLKIEDIPFSDIGKLRDITVSETMLDRVRDVYALAKSEAKIAADDYKEKMARDSKGRIIHSGFGWAHVITYDAHSEPVQALKQLGLAEPIGGLGYFLRGILEMASTEHSLEIESVAANRASDILTKELGQYFTVSERWD